MNIHINTTIENMFVIIFFKSNFFFWPINIQSFYMRGCYFTLFNN